MAEKITIDVVVERIDNLTQMMKEGFLGVHQRQDTANGKLMAHKEWIDRNCKSVEEIPFIKRDFSDFKLEMTKQAGKIAGIGISISIGISIILWILNYYR